MASVRDKGDGSAAATCCAETSLHGVGLREAKQRERRKRLFFFIFLSFLLHLSDSKVYAATLKRLIICKFSPMAKCPTVRKRTPELSENGQWTLRPIE